MFDEHDVRQPADPLAYGAKSLSALPPDRELALRMFARRVLGAQSAEPFLDGMVRLLWAEFDAHVVFVGALTAEGDRVTARIVFRDGLRAGTFSYDLAGTPCETVLGPLSICLYPRDVQAKFPDDRELVEFKAEGYAGVPLFDEAGTHIGILAMVTLCPIEDTESVSAALQFFAPKAAIELERIIAEEGGPYELGAVDAASDKVDKELGDALGLGEEQPEP